MPRLGVGLPTVEKVLNHVSGSFRGPTGVYQRNKFTDEMLDALEKWAVPRMSGTDNVIALTAARLE